jgi:hypothetical protein
MKKITLLVLTLIYSSLVFSQEEEASEKKFSFNGSVDTYFKRNIGAPSRSLEDENGDPYFITPTTAFANRNGFGLGMANLIVSYEGEKVGFVADLGFGPRAEDAVFLSVGSSNIVNQLYMYYNVSENVKLTIGNFNTFLGYEVISPVGNFNYSTSYMFSYGPFSHTGIKADIALGEISLMLAVMNPTDYTEINLDDSYTFGGQVGYKGQFLNVIYGDQLDGATTFQVDFTGGLDLIDSFFLGLNATYNDTDDASFYGVALYPQYKITDDFTLGARGEYFAETDGGAGAIGAYDSEGDASVFAATLTGSYSVGSFTIKPELRLDSTSEKSFVNTDLEPTKSLSSFLVAAIYEFN